MMFAWRMIFFFVVFALSHISSVTTNCNHSENSLRDDGTLLFWAMEVPHITLVTAHDNC